MGKEEMKLGWRESGLKEKYLSQWEIRNVLTAGLCNCANCQKRGDRVGSPSGLPQSLHQTISAEVCLKGEHSFLHHRLFYPQTQFKSCSVIHYP